MDSKVRIERVRGSGSLIASHAAITATRATAAYLVWFRAALDRISPVPIETTFALTRSSTFMGTRPLPFMPKEQDAIMSAADWSPDLDA